MYDIRNRAAWAEKMRKCIPTFHTSLSVNNNVLKETQVDGMNFPECDLTKKLNPPADMGKEMIKCAVNFVNMLAWRLWSDRSIPLHKVYSPRRGTWGDFHSYVHRPVEYSNSLPVGALLLGLGPDPKGLPGGHGGDGGLDAMERTEATQNIEVVIVRPNIEHYMLGIILGQGGESLGSTFWGQTELSCYDDSMHGIWGMSYKYNERAIVINEKNLVRLWDIAYDGYVGGKEDSAVDWGDDNPQNANSCARLSEQTMDVTVPFRGPSMMVMAFDHTEAKEDHHAHIYNNSFQSNWPSPIVFYDKNNGGDSESLPSDFENIHVVQTKQFRVFNNDLYAHKYEAYLNKMPDFFELHKIRKNAGMAAVENEVSSDALAFQGTMRVLHADTGSVIHEIQGSGHHGPDFIGCASLRAGKGYKINSQPTIQRLV